MIVESMENNQIGERTEILCPKHVLIILLALRHFDMSAKYLEIHANETE